MPFILWLILKKRVARLVRVKAYRPPSNVEEQIKQLSKQVFGKDYSEEKHQEIPLSNPMHKFDVIFFINHPIKHLF
jgi:hypothetical protein